MIKHINFRVDEGINGEYLVQGQSPETYNWETIRTFGVNDKGVALGVADSMAKHESENHHNRIYTVFYHGYGLISYLNGTEF